MKRAALVVLLLATGCTRTVVLGTLAADGGTSDLGDMQACTVCDLGGGPFLVDLASQSVDALPSDIGATDL